MRVGVVYIRGGKVKATKDLATTPLQIPKLWDGRVARVTLVGGIENRKLKVELKFRIPMHGDICRTVANRAALL